MMERKVACMALDLQGEGWGSIACTEDSEPRTDQRIGIGSVRLLSRGRRPPVSVIGRELDSEGGQQLEGSSESPMKKIILLAIVAGGIFTMDGPASAQGIYLDLGGDGPRRYRDYDGPRYRDYDGRRYREREQYGDRGDRGYYRPNGARFRTFNGCQNGWTVQDGLCKPYRGY